MPTCQFCNCVVSSGARFCSHCGQELPQQPLKERDLRQSGPSPDWLTIDDILYKRDKRFGGIGVLLAFYGAFAPWATTSVSFLGISVGSSSVNSPQAWLVALAAIAAGIFLFRQRSGSIVMVIGIVIAAFALLVGLTSLGSNASPSWGLALTIAGGGLCAYSGYLTNQYERGEA